MKVYHVFVFQEHRPGCGLDFTPFEQLVALLSVVRHRTLNPTIPIHLLTDIRSYDIFKSMGIDTLYDKVEYDFFSDYPSHRISDVFWASPKVWATKKLKAPFMIMDMDLVLHKSYSYFYEYDFIGLHRESPTHYATPFNISTPENFKWSDAEIESFSKSFPINACLTYWGNDELKNAFADRYFELVFDNPGELYDVNFKKMREHYYINQYPVQLLAEQWLMAAKIQEYKKLNPTIKFKCMSDLIYGMYGFISDKTDTLQTQFYVDEYAYHLWGAKNHYYLESTDPKYISTKNMLINDGMYLLNQYNKKHLYIDLYYEYINKLH